ncbi:MAG: flotillin-like FloA family protein [Planctomycetota bacterium]
MSIQIILVIAGVLGALVLLGMVFTLFRVFNLFIQASMSGAPVGLLELMGMQLRRVNPQTIVYARIKAVKAGLDLTTTQLETHHLAGGDVHAVVDALIAAEAAGLSLDFSSASEVNLTGDDPRELVAAAKANPA